MKKETIKVIMPIEQPKVNTNYNPCGELQNSMPRSINTPAPPKPKK